MADKPLPGGAGITPVSRSAWGAAEPKSPGSPMKVPVPHVVMEWTNSDVCIDPDECVVAVRRLQKAHMDEGEPDIKYNFVLGGDGRVYEGRGWRQQNPFIPTAAVDHPIELKNRNLLLGLIGKMDAYFPSSIHVKILGKLVAQGVVSLYLQQDVQVHALMSGRLITLPMNKLPGK